MPIRTLPAHLVHQIAAGEVVERPASVVKELLENALDAGATRITVETEGGGRRLIRVHDDGRGIPREELALALAPHATSKIAEADDLWRLASFGFRGEALCSVAAVSRLTLTSRASGATDAWRIRCAFGASEDAQPAAGAPGTCIEVCDLFDNVPARRHFLRTEQAEAARITDAVVNAALAHPAVSFRLVHGGRTALDLPAAADIMGRVAAALGEVLGADPRPVTGAVEVPDGAGGSWTCSISGATCRPESMRPTARFQRLFVNGRPVSDRSLAHAAREAYRGLAEPSLVPAFVLMLDCDPGAVDVNVHPQKLEVRWRAPDAMHRLVRRSVQDALGSTDLTREATRLLGTAPPAPLLRAVPGGSPARTAPAAAEAVAPAAVATAHQPQAQPLAAAIPSLGAAAGAPAHVSRFLQMDRSWIVFEEDGALVIVDQHALHERVMFEELRGRLASGALASQQMLVPACADVPPAALARLDTLEPLLARLGISATAAGPRSVAVHAFPGYLADRGVDAARFVADALCDDALASAIAAGDASEAAIADLLDMRACKAAVKAGDRLTAHEISALLARRDEIERAASCPHGRPTMLRIPLDEIARRFGR